VLSATRSVHASSSLVAPPHLFCRLSVYPLAFSNFPTPSPITHYCLLQGSWSVISQVLGIIAFSFPSCRFHSWFLALILFTFLNINILFYLWLVIFITNGKSRIKGVFGFFIWYHVALLSENSKQGCEFDSVECVSWSLWCQHLTCFSQATF